MDYSQIYSETKAYAREFEDQLEEFYKGGPVPARADQDLSYSLELQRQRLYVKGVSLLNDYEGNNNVGQYRQVTYSIFDNSVEALDRTHTQEVYKNSKRIYSNQAYESSGKNITYIKNSQDLSNDLYPCPNCGNVAKVGELSNGCEYCGTYFDIGEHFPKVTSFYLNDDTVIESNKADRIKMIITMIVCMPFVLLYQLIDGRLISDLLTYGDLIRFIIIIILSGVLIGFFAYRLVVFIFLNLRRGNKRRKKQLKDSAKRGESFYKVAKYFRDFSYEYFEGRLGSMLKSIIYSNDARELPFYAGGEVDRSLSDIIDSTFSGKMYIISSTPSGDNLNITAEIYMTNLYLTDNKVNSRREKFIVDIYRNMHKPINYNFHITALNCPSCGGSYDATKHRTCPYCKSAYPLADDDWIITGIRRA